MKEGDWVWYGPNEVEYIYGSGDIDIQRRDDDAVVNTYPEYLIPDVPNLTAIARFLAEHPETVDALGRVAEYHRSLDFLDDKLDDDATEAGEQLAQWLADYGNARDALTTVDTAAVIGLAAAMRGEGGHE